MKVSCHGTGSVPPVPARVKLGVPGPHTHLQLQGNPKTAMRPWGVAGSQAQRASSWPPPWLGMLPLSTGARTCTTAA